MDILQRNRLGADVAATQRVIVVTTNINDLITLRADDQAAHGLAQMADPVMCLGDSVAHSCLALTVPEGPQSQAGVVLRIRTHSSIAMGLLCRLLWAGKSQTLSGYAAGLPSIWDMTASIWFGLPIIWVCSSDSASSSSSSVLVANALESRFAARMA